MQKITNTLNFAYNFPILFWAPNRTSPFGKNPAITVVAKAEFPQSYKAQPQTALLCLNIK